MSAPSPNNTHEPLPPVPEWFSLLGLDEPARCARQLAESMADDPFHIIGFTAITAWNFRSEFNHLVDWVGGYESSLLIALPEIAAALPSLPATGDLRRPNASERAALPLWLRELDKLECSGIMRRFDCADRSKSSYLIESTFADGQVGTARLSIRHGEVDRITEFWTTCMSLGEAARFYRKRYVLYTNKPYRHVKLETAFPRILEAWDGSVSGDQYLQDVEAPIPWPQNMPVLYLLMRAAVGQMEQ